jgi:hypothetical protein
MKNKEEYKDWYDEIVWLKDKVILPKGRVVYKGSCVTKDGFDTEKFNNILRKIWLNTNTKADGRRYKTTK